MSALLPYAVGVVIGLLIWFNWYRPWQEREFFRKRREEIERRERKL